MKADYKKGDEEAKVHSVLMGMNLESPTECVKDVDAEEYKMGMEMEGEEHKDIAHGDVTIVQKIVMAHLKEDKKYYSKLKKLEGEDEEEEKEEEKEEKED